MFRCREPAQPVRVIGGDRTDTRPLLGQAVPQQQQRSVAWRALFLWSVGRTVQCHQHSSFAQAFRQVGFGDDSVDGSLALDDVDDSKLPCFGERQGEHGLIGRVELLSQRDDEAG